MCGPFAALALLAGGSIAKYIGDTQAQHAQQAAQDAERARQQQLTQRQQQAFQESVTKANSLADPNAETAAVDKRNTALQAALTPASAQADFLPGSSSAPQLVQDAGARTAADTHAYSSNLAQALARLSGTGDQLLTTNIGIGRDAGAIGQLADFKQGSADVLPAELRAAATKGALLRGLGGIAQSIGGAAAGGGGFGGGGGGIAAGADGVHGLDYSLFGVPTREAPTYGGGNQGQRGGVLSLGYGG